MFWPLCRESIPMIGRHHDPRKAPSLDSRRLQTLLCLGTATPMIQAPDPGRSYPRRASRPTHAGAPPRAVAFLSPQVSSMDAPSSLPPYTIIRSLDASYTALCVAL